MSSELRIKLEVNGPFVREMVERRNSFLRYQTIAVRAVVPFSLRWWYWLEYGTATRGLPGHEGPAYPISPIKAPKLKFWDYEGKYRGDGKAGWFETDFILHPGIYPRRFVFHAMQQIILDAIPLIRAYFVPGKQLRADTLRLHMMTVLPEVIRFWLVSMLIASPEIVPTGWQGTTFNIKFRRSQDPWNAKLGGQLAHDVFNANLTINDSSR